MRIIAETIMGVALAATIVLSGTARAQENVWRIAKVTGQAWLGGDGVATAALSQDAVLKPGDSIRTGRNGRVLLVRGAETMMVSANSAISLPDASRSGMTTVIQQAGSVLLDVEKRNVQHFEVETPYLAAVVKGTRFTVTVANGRAQVNVARGQVQVADFRSGQFALVLPGQSASVAPQRSLGLQLSGAGAFGAIQQGPAQAPRVQALPVPQKGFSATPPRGGDAPASPVLQEARSVRDAGVVRGANGGLRIAAPMGEVKLDIHKVTGGLARSATATATAGTQGRNSTIWGNSEGTGRSDISRIGNSGSTVDPAGSGQSNTATAKAAALGNSVSTMIRVNGNGNASTDGSVNGGKQSAVAIKNSGSSSAGSITSNGLAASSQAGVSAASASTLTVGNVGNAAGSATQAQSQAQARAQAVGNLNGIFPVGRVR